MTDTTKTFWDVDGESLQTYAQNITTLGGDRLTPPPVRGANLTVPFAPGEVWVPKVPDARTITLGMWISGANEDGTIPTSPGPNQKFMDNWRTLRRLLWRPRRQFTLTKRFWLPRAELVAAGVDADALPRNGTYRLLSASAKGEFAGGLSPQMDGPGHAAFTVDIRLADPYFYSAQIERPFSVMAGTGLPGPTQTIEVLGDDRTLAIGVEFEGPMASPKLTNHDWAVEFTYGIPVSDGIRAAVDVKDFQALHDLDGTTYTSAGAVTHSGDAFWMFLEPGSNELELTATSGTGTATLTYQPVWL